MEQINVAPQRVQLCKPQKVSQEQQQEHWKKQEKYSRTSTTESKKEEPQNERPRIWLIM